jgi:seryl-tRNA synthetase
MLQISYIRENKDKVITALAKKHLDAKTIIEEVIELDENRRSTQNDLDNTLAEANKLSSAIGEMMKNGEKAKAEILKLPNLPADIVPEGKTPEENLNVFQEGDIPVLHEGATTLGIGKKIRYHRF